ncbi:MAG TPA: protein kinase, partial [Gemmataceae bacterium]|nr:protein kinase [Gemmataceae bacterium]
MTSKQNPVELANPDDPRVFPLLHEYWEALQRQENLELDPWLRQHPEGCAGRGDFEVLAELHRAAQVITEDSRLDSADTAEIAALKKGRQVLPAGTLVGECRVESLLGQGGMGAVYLAYHTKLQQRVALKVLPDERMGHPAAVARFEREMAAVGQLDHPNVVRARHAGQAGGIHFLL